MNMCVMLSAVVSTTLDLALRGYYAASCDNPLPSFRDNVSVPSSRVKKSKKKRKPNKPSKLKELTKGGDLHLVQVDVPWSV
jgi:hypothetical protein